MKKIIVILVLMVQIISAKIVSEENNYTIDGRFTYHEALRALSVKTGRSVIGSNQGLEMERTFDIYKKKFTVAVEEIRKNLFTDGYTLYVDTDAFYVVKRDSLSKKYIEDTVKTMYLPYSKRYIVTYEKKELLNAKQIDKENYLRDSIKLNDSLIREEKRKTVYKCDLYMIGSVVDTNENRGLILNSPVLINAELRSIASTGIEVGLKAGFDFLQDSMNFRRHMVFYLVGDSTNNLMFGDETRRINSEITSSTGAVSTNYESIYNGLTLSVNRKRYELIYRIEGNQIKLVGVADSLIAGSSYFRDKQYSKNWFVFKYRGRRSELFYFAAIMKVTNVDKGNKE